MTTMRLAFAVSAITSLSWAQELPSPAPLRATHDALFASFLPVDELAEDASRKQMLAATSDQIWSLAGSQPDFHRLLQPFVDLNSIGAACGVADYIEASGASAFSKMAARQRQHVLFLLQTCSVNEFRMLAMSVRQFYVSKAYSALQENLAGIRLRVYADSDAIERARPKLPPSKLRYDPVKNEITSADGPFDYAIVGSGPAGSVLAHELRRGGKRVLLIERGSFVIPGSMETRLVGDLLDSRTSVDGAIRINNGMAVGGGSQVNVDLCFSPTLPSVQAKIDGWRREGRIEKSDFTKTQLASAYEWVKTAIGTRSLTEDEINPNNRVLWEGARSAGLHPKLYDLNTYPPNRSPFPVTDKRSAQTELILKALQDAQNQLSLLPDADVRRVIFTDRNGERTATGVELRVRPSMTGPGVLGDLNGLKIDAGRTVRIRARTVILSAGALGTTAILLRSQIGNDQVGRGVVLHPSMPILGRFEHRIDALQPTQASVFVDDKLVKEGYALESMSAPPVYGALMSPGPPKHVFDMVTSFVYLAGFGVMLVDTPSQENRVTLDGEGEPVIHYSLSKSDKERFRRGVASAIRIMLLAGAKQVYLPSIENLSGVEQQEPSEVRPTILTDVRQAERVAKQLQFTPNMTIVTSAHMQATNKMGSSPRDSVVSRDFAVWGTRGLYVMDAGVFPTSIGANPMQSIYTFAKIFSDRLSLENP